MLKTIEEIKDNILEMCCGDREDADYMFNHLWDETCKHLNEYGEDDEFYTDGDKYYPKDYAKSLYEHRLGIAYIEDRDLRPDLQEYCEQEVFTDLWLGYDYPQSKFKEAVKEFVMEDYEDFMDFYMEGNYEDSGNDSALD